MCSLAEGEDRQAKPLGGEEEIASNTIQGSSDMEHEDHRQTARDFLTASDREFLDGDHLQASEKLWGAATHAVMAAAVERNWRLPPMGSWPDVLAMVEEAGFTRIEEQDLSAEALPSADRIRQGFLSVSFLNPQLRETNPAFQEFMDASVAYAEGLSEGLFTYRFISAMRPVGQQQSR